ncbi:hypothetical protein RHSIM_Rhsim07G0150200 [Rhododendron simsii]|uniref:Uncharacterized protein n=1 Tax=Rhododendron simsii TaxID=118357 RepID=A0A834GPG2_RHOSS|nr:hypothetical protein RHSIM_Rhsim07G0150200 [Rhododendron simsii]
MNKHLQVPTSTYAPNDNVDATSVVGLVPPMQEFNVDAISVVELVPPMQEFEREATNMNFITVVSLIFLGIALVMAMAAIMKLLSISTDAESATTGPDQNEKGFLLIYY